MAEGYNFDAELIEQEMREDEEKRKRYLGKVANGRMARKVNPNQPAFGELAERARQLNAATSANRHDTSYPSDEQDEPQGYDFSLVDPDPQAQGYDFSNVDSVRSGGTPAEVRKPFHPGQILDWVSQPLDKSMGLSTAAEDLGLGNAPPEYAGRDPIARIGGEIVGAGHAILKQILDAIHTPLDLATGGIGLPKPGIGTAREVIPPLAGDAPKIINQSELDALVKTRDMARGYSPDSPELGPNVPLANKPYGTIMEPTLAPGEHTDVPGKRYGRKTAKGEKVNTPSSTGVGEFQQVTPESVAGEEGVTSALSDEQRLSRSAFTDAEKPDRSVRGLKLQLRNGKLYDEFNREIISPDRLGVVSGTLNDASGQMSLLAQGGGKHVIGPESQLDIFNQPLRGQYEYRVQPPPIDPLSMEGSYRLQYNRYLGLNAGQMPAGEKNIARPVPPRYDSKGNKSAQAIYTDPLSRTEWDVLMANDPAERGRVPLSVKVGGKDAAMPEHSLPNFGGKSASVGPRETPRFKNYPDIPSDITVGNTGDGAVLPNLYNTVVTDNIQQLKSTGPVGEHVGLRLENALTQRAIGTATDFTEVEKRLDQILGRNGFLERKYRGLQDWFAGENSFIVGMQRRWNISPEEVENLFNYMYTQGKIPAMNDRVRETARVLFEYGTYPASNHPGVRTLTRKNPITGKEEPLGNPSMFLAHQPVKQMAIDALNNRQWEMLYERMGGRQGTGRSLDEYREDVMEFSRNNPEITAAKFKSLENMRLLDLAALGGSPYQWAKRLGLETDPFRNVFKFNSMARLRGEFALVEQDIRTLMNNVPLNDPAGKWMRKAIQRAMLNDNQWDMVDRQVQVMRGIGRFMDASMLQLGSLGNTMQLAYPMARGGVKATVKGVWDMLTRHDKEIIEKSGALMPAIINEITNPSGALARVDSAIMTMYGIKPVDRGVRRFAAHVGNAMIEGLERNLLANPHNANLVKSINELGGDAKAILQAGRMPEEMRYAMIQRFTNYSTGVTDARGLPLWATTENPYFRFVNKYRNFAHSNLAEIDRMVRNAPNGSEALRRGVMLLMGAEAGGAAINTARQYISDAILGNEKNPSKSRAQWLLENLLIGLGTIPGMIVVQTVNRPDMVVPGLIAGPVASVGGSLIQDMSTTIKHGFGWRSLDTIADRTPIVGPVLGPIVERKKRKEAKRAQYMNSLAEGDD